MNDTNLHHEQSNRDALLSDIAARLTKIEQEGGRTRPSRSIIAGHTKAVRESLSELVGDVESDDEISESRRKWMLVGCVGATLLLIGHFFR